MKIKVLQSTKIQTRNSEYYVDITSARAICNVDLSAKCEQALKKSIECGQTYGFYIRNSMILCDIRTGTMVIVNLDIDRDPDFDSPIQVCKGGTFWVRANKCVREICDILLSYGFVLDGRITLFDSITKRFWT